jgi:murein DD-endopeptidase MepM/ murein hydrolase activator NlpD/3D (Asp-Asp-Asp) domain-containing protein/lysophospholipase L1-like esterase
MKRAIKKLFNKSSSIVVMCLLFIVVQGVGTVSALTEEQKKLINKNVLYYNIDECSDLNQQALPTAGGKIYMMGDSITVGAKDNLAKELTDAGFQISKINGAEGRSFTSPGSGTANGLQALNEDKLAIESSNIVIIALGTNGEDAPDKSSVFKRNALSALDRIEKTNANAKIYWVNIFSDSPPIKHKADYNDVIKNLPNVSVIDMNKEGISLSDKIHPDAAGYKKYAEAVAEKLAQGDAGTPPEENPVNPRTGSLGGVNGTGFTRQEVAKAKALNNEVYKTKTVKEGTYTSTAYGPPWNAMQGSGTSSTGIPLDGPKYGVAVDPKTLPYGSMVYITPNPFNWDGPFLVMDTGGAFLDQGQKLDFYDWKGRAHQEAWGRQDVKVTKVPGGTADTEEKPQAKGECACRLGSSTGVGGDVDKFIKALAYQESGGNPAQPGSAGGARGKYQYIDSTWKSSAEAYYKPALQYATANVAPESAQDAVAFLEYSKKFKDLNNDLFKLAVSHFYPAANSDPGLLDVVPPSNVITPRQYASKLISSIEKGGEWEKIPLKYQEAPEFSEYAKKLSVSGESSGDKTGSTLSSELCSSESDADNSGGVGKVSWPVSKTFWDKNSTWFTKPHHDYPASDIPVASGTKVFSMTEGKVLNAGAMGSCGVGVIISSGDGFELGYCHGTPGSLKVKPGDKVRSGQAIMLSDNTGESSGAHLHVQIKKGGVKYCPQDAFKALGAGKEPDFSKLATSGCSY